LLIIALWVALLVSLLEGISFLALQVFPYFTLGLWVLVLSGAVLATPMGQWVTRRLPARPEPAQSVRELITRPLLIAIWSGLVAGLVEGVILLTVQKFVYLDEGVWTQIVWISALFDLLLVGALGLVLAGIALLSWRLGMTTLPITTFSVFLFSFLTLYNWLLIGLTNHINQYALLILSVGLTVAFTRWSYQKQAAIVGFCRRSLPYITAVVVLGFIGIQGGIYLKERFDVAALPPSPVGSPNILIIVADTLRADHLSIYGYQRSTSPNIDRLAKEGTLFEAAFSVAPWTLPSHASMLTGLYPHEHGVQRNGNDQPNLRGSYLTLPESLRARGYRTAAFSTNTWWFTRAQGFGQGFIRFENFFYSPVDMALRTIYGRRLWTPLSGD
jgi:hypothetical protein